MLFDYVLEIYGYIYNAMCTQNEDSCQWELIPTSTGTVSIPSLVSLHFHLDARGQLALRCYWVFLFYIRWKIYLDIIV